MPFNYRSTNTTGYTHHGGAFVIGTEMGSGIELNPTSSGASPTILPCGDETSKSLIIAGKGTGGVQIGASSTSAFSLVQRTLLQFTVPALSSAGASGSGVDSTVTMLGASTSDVFIVQQRAPFNSTADPSVFVTARCSTADELKLTILNLGPSTLSGSTVSAYLVQFKF